MPKNNVLPKGAFFTTIPDHFLSQIMTELSASELRVMLYIYLHTLGYGKLADSISYEQFLEGVITRNGERLDKGAGVSRRSLISALASLEKRGLISRTHQGFRAATIKLEVGISTLADANDTAVSLSKSDTFDITFSHPKDEEKTGLPISTKPASYKPAASSHGSRNKEFNSFREEQNLPFSNSPRVQNLPLERAQEVQNLPLTWKEEDKSHEEKNRVQSTTAELTAIKTVVEQVTGITEKEAEKLVVLAFNRHGRDQFYIERITSYVISNPKIENKAACLTSLIKHDLDRTSSYTLTRSKSSSLKNKAVGLGFFGDRSRDKIKTYSTATPNLGALSSCGDNFSDLLVKRHLVHDYSKADHLVQLAARNNLSSKDMHELVCKAQLAPFGKRSQCFEKLLNAAIDNASNSNHINDNNYPCRTNVSRVTFSNPIDFAKYQPGGKYGFLIATPASC